MEKKMLKNENENFSDRKNTRYLVFAHNLKS